MAMDDGTRRIRRVIYDFLLVPLRCLCELLQMCVWAGKFLCTLAVCFCFCRKRAPRRQKKRGATCSEALQNTRHLMFRGASEHEVPGVFRGGRG